MPPGAQRPRPAPSRGRLQTWSSGWARPSLFPSAQSDSCCLHGRDAPSMPSDPPSVRSILALGPGSDQRAAGLPLSHRQRNKESARAVRTRVPSRQGPLGARLERTLPPDSRPTLSSLQQFSKCDLRASVGPWGSNVGNRSKLFS